MVAGRAVRSSGELEEQAEESDRADPLHRGVGHGGEHLGVQVPGPAAQSDAYAVGDDLPEPGQRRVVQGPVHPEGVGAEERGEEHRGARLGRAVPVGQVFQDGIGAEGVADQDVDGLGHQGERLAQPVRGGAVVPPAVAVAGAPRQVEDVGPAAARQLSGQRPPSGPAAFETVHQGHHESAGVRCRGRRPQHGQPLPRPTDLGHRCPPVGRGPRARPVRLRHVSLLPRGRGRPTGRAAPRRSRPRRRRR